MFRHSQSLWAQASSSSQIIRLQLETNSGFLAVPSSLAFAMLWSRVKTLSAVERHNSLVYTVTVQGCTSGFSCGERDTFGALRPPSSSSRKSNGGTNSLNDVIRAANF
jgi:hypothetical protein